MEEATGSAMGSLPQGSLTGSDGGSSGSDGGSTGSLPGGSLPGSSGSDAGGSLGSLGSTAGLGSLLPVVLVGGSIAAAPMVGQFVADLNLTLPALPGLPPLAGSAMPGPAPVQAPAPGPVGEQQNNGRGGEPGTAAAVTGGNSAVVATGSMGDYELPLPAGVTLPPLPFIR